MATGNVMPDPKFTGLDNDGNPLSGGKVYFYSAGPLFIYQPTHTR